MACNNLGLFFSASDPDSSCAYPLSFALYGSGLTIGDVVYTNSACTSFAVTAYYSDGIDVYDIVSGTINGISGCTCPQFFCVENDTNYDDTYQLAGTYDGQSYFTGQTNGYFMFYSTGETRWCLAQNLGDPCDQFGPFGSTSSCPDFDDTVAYTGICVTTTTTVNPCITFDFTAIFDCLVTPSPSSSPPPTPTPTPTPTPSSTNLCGGAYISASAITVSYSPTPTMTPTPTPTPQITRPCNFSGEVIFNTFDEILQCANSKKFKDCFTGLNYFSSDLLLLSGNTKPKEGYVYNAVINGQGVCVVYEGLFENISGVDNITLTFEVGSKTDGACLDCLPNLTQTPTPSPTQTPTPTPTSSPCILTRWYVENNSPSPIKYNYYECDGSVSTGGLNGYTSAYVCSVLIPTSSSPNFTSTDSGTIC